MTVVADLACLRVLVAAAGERTHPPWWPSQFLTPTGQGWIARVFPRTQFVARVSATTKAAARVHDAAVGGQSRYHLFRLPIELESAVVREVLPQSDEFPIATQDDILRQLGALATDVAAVSSTGPALIGPTSLIGRSITIRQLAATYLAAIVSGTHVFPYFEEAR